MHTHTKKYLDSDAERHYHKQAFEIKAGHNHKRFLNCEHTSVRFQQEELCVYWRTLLASILSGVIWGQLSPQLYLSALHSPAAASSCSSLTCHHPAQPSPGLGTRFYWQILLFSIYSILQTHRLIIILQTVGTFVFCIYTLGFSFCVFKNILEISTTVFIYKLHCIGIRVGPTG